MNTVISAPDSAIIPPDVVKINDIVNRYREEVARHNQAIQGLMGEESSVRKIGADWCGTAIHDVVCTHKTIERFRDLLVSYAESRLAPDGAQLSINLREVAPACQAATVDGFDACGLWTTLAAHYSGGVAAASAYGELAARIIRHFREFYQRNESGEVKTVSGRVVLTSAVHMDSFPGDEYSYRSREDLLKIGDDLAALLAWSGLGAEADPQRVRAEFRNAFWHDRKFSGVRFMACPHIMVVPFKSKVEYRVTADFADSLKLFLAEFGAPDQEQA